MKSVRETWMPVATAGNCLLTCGTASGLLSRIPSPFQQFIRGINLFHSPFGKNLKLRCQARNLVRVVHLRQLPVSDRNLGGASAGV